MDEEGMPEVGPVIMQAAREIEPAAPAVARFGDMTEQSQAAVIIQYSKNFHQWALSKHTLYNHDPVTGAIPSCTNVRLLPIQDNNDVVAFYENTKVMEKAFKACTGQQLTITIQMQKTAERILSSFGSTAICEAFKDIYDRCLRGFDNEFAQYTACGNPSCPNKDAINLDSIDDYVNPAPACVICGMARCHVCNPMCTQQCMCSSHDIATVILKHYMTADPEEVSYRTLPLALILIIVGLPTGSTEGLQYRLKSGEGSPIEKAAHVHDERLQATTLATGDQPGAQQHAQQDPTAFWKEKASRSVYKFSS